MNRAGFAAVLSFFVPGAGQIYNGDFFRGLLWFTFAWFVGLALTPLSMGFASIIYHVFCARSAYRRAEQLGYGKLPVQL